ncbi:hypothetical protein [Paenibacillus campinasensis]|uniref:Uncharacterized protein n=1 Tax=Paenibacillus campinasensis TaxID=66347 RepID=A0A268ETB3_9BACL|nr:hypothetical protein [Paenibacillus campinasensis]PAD76369.1 hypothetical protein CHH67_12120 [Paenibacillus campinasensis]
MRKPNALEALAYALHSAGRKGTLTSEKLDVLARLEAHVLGIDWRKDGALLPVVKLALMGKSTQDITEQLDMDLDEVERMLFRTNQQLHGKFTVALAHYFAGDYPPALHALSELGYSDFRFLPAEVYQRYSPKRGQIDLEECETELRFLASLSLARLHRETEPKREKVEHLLALFHSVDPRDRSERAQLFTALDELLSGLYVSPSHQNVSSTCIQFTGDEPYSRH